MNFDKYQPVFEKQPQGGWGAYVPDFPIIRVKADTREECELLASDAIAAWHKEMCDRYSSGRD